MADRIFYLDILDDLPILVAIFMSVFPEFQNRSIFYTSLVIGVASTVALSFFIKKISMEKFIMSFSTSLMLGYIIYVFMMFGFVIYLSLSDRLYMEILVWLYILFNFIFSIFSMKQSPEGKI